MVVRLLTRGVLVRQLVDVMQESEDVLVVGVEAEIPVDEPLDIGEAVEVAEAEIPGANVPVEVAVAGTLADEEFDANVLVGVVEAEIPAGDAVAHVSRANFLVFLEHMEHRSLVAFRAPLERLHVVGQSIHLAASMLLD